MTLSEVQKEQLKMAFSRMLDEGNDFCIYETIELDNLEMNRNLFCITLRDRHD